MQNVAAFTLHVQPLMFIWCAEAAELAIPCVLTRLTCKAAAGSA